METQVNGVVTKPVGRRNGIYGIVVDRLKGDSLRDAAKDAGLAVGEEDSAEWLATSLQEFYKRQQAEKKLPLYQCEVKAGGCGADQPRDEGACPFCGFDPDAKAKVDIAPGLEVSGEDTPQEPPTDITDPEKVLGDTSPVEPRARKPKKDKGPKGRLSQPPPMPADAKVGDMPVAGSSTGLAKVYPTALLVPKDDSVAASELLTERTLDDAVDRFRVAGRNAKTAWWHQARAYLDIFEKKLYLLRPGEGGKPKYKSIQEFASKELGINGQYQWDVLDAAKAWPEEDAAELGMTNCVLILKAPEEARKQIADRVRTKEITATHHKSKGKDSTASAVSRAIKEKGKVETKGTVAGERKVGGGRKKESVKVVIADYLRKNTLGFLATPVGGEKAAKVTDVPPAVAKWLEKVQPYAQHESLDGEVVETFALVVKDGALKLVIHRDRSTAGE